MSKIYAHKLGFYQFQIHAVRKQHMSYLNSLMVLNVTIINLSDSLDTLLDTI